jgi:tetratricopeptide (TPR) repeat protein
MGNWNWFIDDIGGCYNGVYNSDYNDVYVFGSSVVYAEYNWWGDDHTPSYWVESGSTFDWANPYTWNPWPDYYSLPTKDGGAGKNVLSLKKAPTSIPGQVAAPRQHSFKDDLMKALLFRKLGRYNDALGLYKKLLIEENSFRPAIIELSFMYKETKDDAILDFFKSLEAGSKSFPLAQQNSALISSLLASMNVQRGDYSTAKQLFDGVISQYAGTPDERHARFEKFYIALHLQKNKEEATGILNELATRYPEGEDIEFARYLLSDAGGSSVPSKSQILLSKKGIVRNVPERYELAVNYPNPFNPTTTIRYAIPQPSVVVLKVYDMLGKDVATLVNEEKPIGYYEVEFDASRLSSGIYFYHLQSGNFHDIKKMLLVK